MNGDPMQQNQAGSDLPPKPAGTRNWSRTLRIVGSVLLIVIGLGWTGQGLGVLPGSMMSGEPFWAAAGIVLVIAGVILAWLSFRRPSVGA